MKDSKYGICFERLRGSKFFICISNLDPILFLITFFTLLWVVLYKIWFINIETEHNWLVISGDICFSIALSIIAGYFIFFITSECPSILRKRDFLPVYVEFVSKLYVINFILKLYFDLNEEDIKSLSKSDDFQGVFLIEKIKTKLEKNRIEITEENIQIEITRLKDYLENNNKEIKVLITERIAFLGNLPKSFSAIVMLNNDLENRRNYINQEKAVFSEAGKVETNFRFQLSLLDYACKFGTKDLIKLGCNKKYWTDFSSL